MPPIIHNPQSTISTLQFLPDELRLAATVLLSVFAFASALRFSRRVTRHDWISNTTDAWLMFLLIQYLAVCVPGLAGLLNPLTMCVTALLLSTALCFAPSPSTLREGRGEGSVADPIVVIACVLFVLGYYFGIVSEYLYAPVLGDDALTYHLPAAVQWLKTGHISLYTTWFFNPANTYSPLAGSTFMAWLMGPLSSDVLVRFVQFEPWLMIFFALIEVCRAIGVRTWIAAMIAAAALLSRPLLSQSFEVKDDLLAAAFFIAALAAASPERLRDRLGPWRLGAAVGLFAATKYTVLLSAPLLLLVVDAPFRARWNVRRWIIALTCAVMIAGPWYLRNWIVAGNPLYPIAADHIFPGLFGALRSTEMNSVTGIWDSVTDRREKFHSPSPALLIVLIAAWLLAVVGSLVRGWMKELKHDPVARITILGPPIGFAIFVALSHAAEIRYLYPALLLLFACTALALDRLTRLLARQLDSPSAACAALAVVALSIWGSFKDKSFVAEFSGFGVASLVIGGVLATVLWRWLRGHTRRWQIAGIAALLGLSAVLYVRWPAYDRDLRASVNHPRINTQGSRAQLWQWIDEHVPADATIAYTNTFLVHPLLGFDHTRTIFYAPTRPGIHAYHDLPPSNIKLTDQQIRAFCAAALTKNADRATWVNNLRPRHPQYLLIGKQDVLPTPPERVWADEDPAHFTKLFENDAGAVFEVRGYSSSPPQ